MRNELTVMGKVLGIYEDWDSYKNPITCFYNFFPSEGVNLPQGHLEINFSSGELTITRDNEEPYDTTFLELIGAK